MKLPVYFISHGGGPWSFMSDSGRHMYFNLEKSLQNMAKEVGEKPKAILMISAHWETEIVKVQSAAKPAMIYDYYGFPDYTYAIQYPASGDPQLASKIQSLLIANGIACEVDSNRGYDHGTYTPMKVSFPNADVPIVQLSILRHYDPEFHFKIGQAIAPLRDEGILIIASGLSYHNLRAFFGPAAREPAEQFDRWLCEKMLQENLEQRNRDVLNWTVAPSARAAHPREDHLVPLFVALGAAENDEAKLCYHEDRFMGNISVSSFILK